MRCRRCKHKTRIVDTRLSSASESSLVSPAKKMFPGIEIKVRRHKCVKCEGFFDTYEIAKIDIMKIVKKD